MRSTDDIVSGHESTPEEMCAAEVFRMQTIVAPLTERGDLNSKLNELKTLITSQGDKLNELTAKVETLERLSKIGLARQENAQINLARLTSYHAWKPVESEFRTGQPPTIVKGYRQLSKLSIEQKRQLAAFYSEGTPDTRRWQSARCMRIITAAIGVPPATEAIGDSEDDDATDQ